MTLIKSISGIRGTIGGDQGDSLTSIDIVKFTSAFANFLQKTYKKENLTIVVGRDARISGKMVNSLVSGSLMAVGCDVIDLGLSTTPTVEMAVIGMHADGGIILTASHNPKHWNALKLLTAKGEFLNALEGAEVLERAKKQEFNFAEVDSLGKYTQDDTWIEKHIDTICDLDLVDIELVKNAGFSVAYDAINSTGAISIEPLLKRLGVKQTFGLYTDVSGEFAHNPEPLPKNLTDISNLIKSEKIDIGFVVDPDVDRLAIVDENGKMFGEEYTLVAISDYVLQNKKGSTVSNLSSSLALRDVTEAMGCEYFSAAVGEVNVVAKMKEKNAIIGGEGNGGIIYPELHYGRDALVGIAMFLTYLAKTKKSVSELRATYPKYEISKNKIELTPDIDVDNILLKMEEKYKDHEISTIDGVKVIFDKQWVHLRKSNTEAIIRVYTESETIAKAEQLANKIINEIKALI